MFESMGNRRKRGKAIHGQRAKNVGAESGLGKKDSNEKKKDSYYPKIECAENAGYSWGGQTRGRRVEDTYFSEPEEKSWSKIITAAQKQGKERKERTTKRISKKKSKNRSRFEGGQRKEKILLRIERDEDSPLYHQKGERAPSGQEEPQKRTSTLGRIIAVEKAPRGELYDPN